MLVNEKATLANLRQEISQLAARYCARGRSAVLIYFAGHGFIDERQRQGVSGSIRHRSGECRHNGGF